jgi:uncharacterized membrane protein
MILGIDGALAHHPGGIRDSLFCLTIEILGRPCCLVAEPGGFVGAGLYIHLMQMIGWLMIALFVWLFHGPWLTFKRAVDAEDWPSAGATLNRIRQIIAVNLPLGLLVVVIGGGGRY